MSKIAVVIVNWNTGELLAQCVRSLLDIPESEKALLDSIVVIDNASTDHSFAQLRQQLPAVPVPPVHCIASDQNLGFARANNQAIRQHIANQAADMAHILLLNPDTKVLPGAMANLARALDQNERAGIIGPRLVNADDSLQPSVRRFPTAAVMVSFFLKMGRLLPRTRFGRRYLAADFDYRRPQLVDQVMGAAFLIRNRAWQQLGELDEKFWIWFEEVDYCRRAHDANWTVVYTPTASIVHFGGVSFGKLTTVRRSMAFLQNAWRYTHKHLGFSSTLLVSCLFPLAVLLTILAVQRSNPTQYE